MGCVIASQSVNSPTGSSGLIGPNCEIKIIDLKTGKTLGTNQKGEICAKSITMISSYYKNPEITKKAIDEDGQYKMLITREIKKHFSEQSEFFQDGYTRGISVISPRTENCSFWIDCPI